MIEHVLSHPYSYFYISRDDLRASSSLRLPLTSFPLLAYDQTSATLLTFGHFATHLGNDSVVVQKCIALVSSCKCNGKPGSQDMDPEYDCCGDSHGDHDARQ
jgi:hypothetical protein